MRRLKLFKFFKAFGLMLLTAFTWPAFGQILTVNQGSNISGPEELCAEQKGDYQFKHDVKDCLCDNIEWSVSNGSFDPAPTVGPAPFNDKVKVKWDKGKSTGTVSLVATNCYKEFDDDGQPLYEVDWNRNESYTVHIFDASMVNLFVSGQSSLSCNTTEITLSLDVKNVHLSPNQLQSIQWSVPSNWTIQPNQEVGGSFYGATFPNVKIATNGTTVGQNMVSVTYSSPNFCPSKTYNRSVTFNIGDCKPVILYPGPPGFHQSHSAVSTDFVFGQPAVMSSGSAYTFVAGEEINLETNFEVVADGETTFEAFIAACGCNSPWHDPNEKGETTVTFDGNFNKKSSVVNDVAMSPSNQPAQAVSASDFRLHIYPNPSGGIVWIEANGISGMQKITLHSIEGRKVFEENHDFDANPNFQIDLRYQPKSLYIITVMDAHSGTYHNEKLMLE